LKGVYLTEEIPARERNHFVEQQYSCRIVNSVLKTVLQSQKSWHFNPARVYSRALEKQSQPGETSRAIGGGT
jgi:hypothetical protein